MSGRSRRRGREHGHLGCLRGRPGLRADRASHSSLRAVAAGSRGRVTEPQAGGCGGAAGHTRELEPHGGGAGPAEGHGREQGVAGFGLAWGQPGGAPRLALGGMFLGLGRRAAAGETAFGVTRVLVAVGARDAGHRATTRPRPGAGGLGSGGRATETGRACPRREESSSHLRMAGHLPLTPRDTLSSGVHALCAPGGPCACGPMPARPGLATGDSAGEKLEVLTPPAPSRGHRG